MPQLRPRDSRLRAAIDSDRAADWRDQARCRDMDSELFFPIGHSIVDKMQEASAKAVCAPCPVRRRCLQWAVDHDCVDGVWGGMGELERRWLIRTLAAPHG